MGLADFARRVFSARSTSPAPVEEGDALSDRVDVSDRTLISDCVARTVCTVAAVVVKVADPSVPDMKPLAALVEDESGERLEAIWHRRQPISGLVPGVTVTLTGTVRNQQGTKTMLDPAYTIIDGSPA